MNDTLLATVWNILDRIGSQAISFIIGIVLARLLTPEDYGLVGISMVFIAFSNVFIESGFANALIRKLDRTDTDLSTAFYFNLIMGLVMYVVLFFGAPYIADYFDSPRLTILVRIVALLVLTNSLCIVQDAILTAELRIKVQTLINVIALLPSGLTAIYLAYKGLGVYALAIQSVLGAIIRTTALWVVARWRPILAFSRESMSYLWGFGSKLIVANFIGTMFNEMYTMIIGKFVGKTDLGYYSKARSLSSQPDTICNGVVQKVAVPVFSHYQHDYAMLLQKYRDYTKLVFFGMGLVTTILTTVAYPLVVALWSDKWIGSVFPFQMLLVASLFSPPSTLNLSLLQVINHTGYTLKLEFVKKPICLLLIIIGSYYELYGLLIVQIITSIFCCAVNMKASNKYIEYKYRDQLLDISNYLIAVIVSSAIGLYLLHLLEMNSYLAVVIGSLISLIVFMSILYATHDMVISKYLIPIANKYILRK